MLSVDAFHASVSEVCVVLVILRFVGVEGTIVSEPGLMSPDPTNVPPRKVDAYAVKDRATAPVAPSKTATCGAAPGPEPVITSALPSPVTSAEATRTPPTKPAE